MKSEKKMKSQKKKRGLKKMKSQKKKKNENKKFSELKNFQTQSMSVSDNVSIRQCQDLVNFRVRYCQSQIMSGSS